MAQVRDITKRLPELIWPTGDYPLLAVQVDSDKADERSTRVIKQVPKALASLVEGTGVQVMFSSIPLVAGMNAGMNRKTHVINKWLKYGAISGICIFLIMGKFMWHQAHWRQMVFTCLAGAKVF